MQPSGTPAPAPIRGDMRVIDDRLASVLAVGFLSSLVLLSSSAAPPSLTVAELWGLGGDSALTVSGVLVSLRSYESGSEVLVISDEGGSPTVRVVCTTGPGPSPGEISSIGDLLSVSGECVFEDGVPSVFCRYGDVRLLRRCQDVLTVSLLSASWQLFEGDRVSVRGVCGVDPHGALRLADADGGCSIAMLLDQGVAPVCGEVVADCTLVLDTSTVSLVLEVHSLTPQG